MIKGKETGEARRLMTIINRRLVNCRPVKKDDADFLSPVAQLKKVSAEFKEERAIHKALFPLNSKPIPDSTIAENRI